MGNLNVSQFPGKLSQTEHEVRRGLHTSRSGVKSNTCWRLPSWLSSKESTCCAGDTGDAGSIPELGRSPGGGNSNPLQYSCLENPIDRWAWQAAVHRVAKNWTQLKRLSTHALLEAESLPPGPRIQAGRLGSLQWECFVLITSSLVIIENESSYFTKQANHAMGRKEFSVRNITLGDKRTPVVEGRVRIWSLRRPV